MTARPVRRITLIVCASAVTAMALALFGAPLITANAVKLWISQLARQNGSTVSYGAIDAPLLRPVTVRDVKITSEGKTLEVTRIEADLRVAAIWDASRGRAIRSIAVSDLHGEIAAASSPQLLAALLADDFTITSSTLAIRSPTSVVELHDAKLTGSELRPGTFQIGRLVVDSPNLKQTFADIRGGTSWEYNRLTIGGVTVMRGLDVDVVRLDLARAREKRIAIDADLDLFGGKLRASMSADEQEQKTTWDIAASGSEISLGRMSDALGFSTRTSGSLHAVKFTFRGSLDALVDATASVWTEITGFTWRDRTADVVMLGASYYARQISVEQLYVKQRRNELTLSGEFAAHSAAADLPDLRGDISANIGDLGEFARLFGGSPSDFAGELLINGNAAAQERQLAGQLTVSGHSVKLFGAPADAIDARVLLSRSALDVEHCELRRDSAGLPPLSIHGECDFSDRNAVSAKLRLDQPLALNGQSDGCVSEVRVATLPRGEATNAAHFASLDFRGPLFRTGWTITAESESGESQATFNVCTRRDDNRGVLVIAPQR